MSELEATEHQYRPFDGIPPEVLSNILWLALESHCEDHIFAKYRFPSIPCQVSRFFSRTTLSTPVLWSYLFIEPGRTDFVHVMERINRRCGALPLEIMFSLGSSYQEQDEQVVEIVERCSTRWRSLRRELNRNGQDGPWDLLHRLLRCPAPLLRSLTVNYHNTNYFRSSPSFSAAALPLRYLCLNNCHLFNGKCSLPGTLEELHVFDEGRHFVETRHIIQMLQGPQSHSLRRLSIESFATDAGGLIDDHGRTTLLYCILDSLEFLEIRGKCAGDAGIFFDAIHTPNLQHLSIQIHPEGASYQPWPRVPLTLWNSIRFPKLTRLTVAGMNPPEDTLANFFINMPSSVKHLIISRDTDCPIGDLLHALRDARTRSFCGQLERLTVSGLHLDTLFDLAKMAFTSLELLEIDTMDAVLHPDDTMLGMLHAQIAKLETLPAEVRVVKMTQEHDHQRPFGRYDPTGQTWTQLRRMKSILQ